MRDYELRAFDQISRPSIMVWFSDDGTVTCHSVRCGELVAASIPVGTVTCHSVTAGCRRPGGCRPRCGELVADSIPVQVQVDVHRLHDASLILVCITIQHSYTVYADLVFLSLLEVQVLKHLRGASARL